MDTRNGFLDRLTEAINDPGRRDDLSVMLVDLDSFSKINDTYGCPTADSLLQHLGTEIARSMRPLDHVARIDADQFALLLPKTQAMGGKVVAERIRSLVKGSTIAMGTIRPIVRRLSVVSPLLQIENPSPVTKYGTRSSL